MQEYSLKAETIEAIQLEDSKESFNKLYNMLGENIDFRSATDGTFINIKMHESYRTDRLYIGEWLIRDKNGKFYIFDEATFTRFFEKE